MASKSATQFIYFKKTVLNSRHSCMLTPNNLHHTINKPRNHLCLQCLLSESTPFPVLKVIAWVVPPPIIFPTLYFLTFFLVTTDISMMDKFNPTYIYFIFSTLVWVSQCNGRRVTRDQIFVNVTVLFIHNLQI